MTWKSIESAPRDGTAVWLWCDGAAYIGYCEPGGRVPWKPNDNWYLKATVRRRDDGSDDIVGTYAHDAKPTLWQPLPPPPSGEK